MERLLRLGEKVVVIPETQIKEIVGDKMLQKIVLSKPFNGSDELVVDGLFVEIGYEPSVEIPKSIGVSLDERGYIQVDNMMHTNIPGFYAAGDTVNHFGRFKQDITAAAMGTVAATSAFEYVKANTDVCVFHMKP